MFQPKKECSMTQITASPFVLSKLPYEQNALAPCISAETVSYHYNKHHKGYVDKLNELIRGTAYEEMSLEELINSAEYTDKAAIFNNAAQVWNHDFYWKSLSPKGGGKPGGDLGKRIDADFGGYEKFLDEFAEAGIAQFGSGWVWLVENQGKLKITKTSNAENPLTQELGKPLLVLDVWEHAYYLDYQNRRSDYLTTALDKLIHWQFAEMNLG